MLYDQALLAMAYTEAFQATGNEMYRQTAREIFTYVLRDMTSPEGAFFSAEDADSEGEEGKFYVWTEKEIQETLPLEDAHLVKTVFHTEKDGNFKDEASGKKTGANILYLGKAPDGLASDRKIPEEELKARLDRVREKLFTEREKRIHPYKDDKVLTDWNGLMIAALSKGARAFGDPIYEETAQKALHFILDRMRTPDGRLLHRYRDGEAGITANVSDYAFLVWGIIELYEATFDARYLKTALDLNEDMLKHFWDDKGSGLYFTPDDGEALIVRKKEIYDGAIPSGNAVALLNLIRLARFTGNSDLETRAAQLERAFANAIKQLPSGYTMFMTAVDFGLGPSFEVVIVGNSQAEDTKQMLTALRARFIPNKVVMMRPTERDSEAIDTMAPFIRQQVSIDNKATAYVCRNHACHKPTTDADQMISSLR
jgi:uncharacterized protein YyaL (SSP411 family)